MKPERTLGPEAKILRLENAQDMSNGPVKIDFVISVRHHGASPEFYDQEVSEVTLDEATMSEYEQAKDTARIFTQNRDDVLFSAAELLAWFLDKSGTTLEDYVPPEEAAQSFNTGEKVFSVSFPIDFSRNSFHMRTDQGPLDLKRLTLLVEFTITPKRQS